MAAVYRILDRSYLNGRGTVYSVSHTKDENIHPGDLLYDLSGNRFRVKDIGMRGYGTADIRSSEEPPWGILLEPVDRAEVGGSILAGEPVGINFLFCNHPLYRRSVDGDYGSEYQAARELHPCALFSFEDMQQGKLSLYGEKISGLTVYRGWMMRPEIYRIFYQKLEAEGIFLLNTPEEYEKYHLLPKWYGDYAGKTSESFWSDSDDPDEILRQVSGQEGPFIVKDYVKSRKHEWQDACFIPRIEDLPNARRIITNFIVRQSDDLAGGIVLRRFESLKPAGFHDKSGMPLSEEYRVFIYAGKIIAADDYWTDRHVVDLSDAEYGWLGSIACQVRSNFVTVDLARKTDGGLIIMEFGDGQVSGLQQILPQKFYNALNLPPDDILQRDAVKISDDDFV